MPFVLTHDFVHVINKGQTKGDIVEFQTFQKLCKNVSIFNNAFKILTLNDLRILFIINFSWCFF